MLKMAPTSVEADPEQRQDDERGDDDAEDVAPLLLVGDAEPGADAGGGQGEADRVAQAEHRKTALK